MLRRDPESDEKRRISTLIYGTMKTRSEVDAYEQLVESLIMNAHEEHKKKKRALMDALVEAYKLRSKWIAEKTIPVVEVFQRFEARNFFLRAKMDRADREYHILLAELRKRRLYWN